MSIPNLGTKEWDDEVKFFIRALTPDLEKRAHQLGLKKTSYVREMYAKGIRRGKKSLDLNQIPLNQKHITYVLPEVELHEYNALTKPGSEEIMLLHCSDGHAGKITESFNDNVYKFRMENIFKSTMTIVNLQRSEHPIKKLHIVNTGDNVQGENRFQGSVIGNVSMGAMDQVIKLALPTWLNLIFSLKQNFEEIEFDGFMGNHGRYSPDAPETSNWDRMLYDAIKSVVSKEKGIQFNTHYGFSDIVNISGFRFFCFHGDDIPCQQGVPFFAIDKKLKSWYIDSGGFNYALSGHFHKRSSNEIAAGVEHFMCSSLVSDDEWARKKLGISSQPSQWLFGIHPRYGISCRYVLAVDPKFLPRKIEGEN